MTTTALHAAPDLLKLLAHDLRWQILALLGSSDLRVGEIIEQLGQPANLISYHLKLLRKQGLVEARRSDADGRDLYYRLDLGLLRTGLANLGVPLHPALRLAPAEAGSQALALPEPLRVLFVCTGNSARSQMAEALLRQRLGERVEVYSAGSSPKPIHPMTHAVMAARQIGLDGHYPKSLDDFVGQPFDYVVTVCDRAREVCPVHPIGGEEIHWSLPNPAEQGPDEASLRLAFEWIAQELDRRIAFFIQQISPADAP